MQVWRMRTGISITLKPIDRRRLTTVARDRNAPHKHVWRTEIVLLSADGVGTNEIMRRTGKSKICVWRWQERFMQAGYDGLLRDKTRPSRIPPLGSDIAKRVVALTRTDAPVEATHWTATMKAKAVGISASSVQRIWRTHGLQPHWSAISDCPGVPLARNAGDRPHATIGTAMRKRNCRKEVIINLVQRSRSSGSSAAAL